MAAKGEFIEVAMPASKARSADLHARSLHLQLPHRIEDAADNYAEFQAAGAEVHRHHRHPLSHKVWHETHRRGQSLVPAGGRPTHILDQRLRRYIAEEGPALRGTFVINPDGIIKTMEVHSNEIARDVKETLRKLKAAQYTAANPGQVCPPSGTPARPPLTFRWIWSAKI